MHGGHAAERILSTWELRIQEQLTHHFGIVVHGWTGHAEGYCKIQSKHNKTSATTTYVILNVYNHEHQYN